MYEAFWFSLNLIIGVPIAFVLLGLGRELLRAILALASGFRVFELRWGTGDRLWAKSLGPIEFAFSKWPFAGGIIAESGSPRHHLLGRLVQAAGPLLIQIIGALWWASAGPLSYEGLRSDFAPLISLAIANLVLIVIHGLIPVEASDGLRTDIRTILDLCFGRAESNRQARASYYARYARHWLERAQVERARTMLDQGLTQLGRESLLLACQSIVEANDLSSVVDQIACADRLGVVIAEAEPRRREARHGWTVLERLRQALITSIPLAGAILALVAVGAKPISEIAHQKMISMGNLAANDRDAEACQAELARWTRWTPTFEWILPDAPETDRDRLGQLARLERCRGRIEAAAAHQSRAISAAEEALALRSRTPGSDPNGWLENEIGFAALLRHSAELDGERRRYRLALASLDRATHALERAANQMDAEFQSSSSGPVKELIAREKGRLASTRREILDRMSAR